MEIGLAYRKRFSEEDNETILIQSISSKTSQTTSNLKALSAAVRKDFETKNTIMLNGWFLSRTEAQQCALFSIINSK